MTTRAVGRCEMEKPGGLTLMEPMVWVVKGDAQTRRVNGQSQVLMLRLVSVWPKGRPSDPRESWQGKGSETILSWRLMA